MLRIGGYNQPFLDQPLLTPPAFFKAGTRLPTWRDAALAERSAPLLQGLRYRVYGQPVAVPTPPPHPAVQDGRWRQIPASAAPLRSASHGEPCPESGIWLASVAADHPAFARQGHPTTRQAWVQAGAAFPLLYPHKTPLVSPAEVTWYLLEGSSK